MQVINPTHFDDNDGAAFDFTIRDKVRAIPCAGGAQLVDNDGNVTASYADDCYVIEGDDGEHRIASRYVFDAFYEVTDDGFDESADFAPAETESTAEADWASAAIAAGYTPPATTAPTATPAGQTTPAETPTPEQEQASTEPQTATVPAKKAAPAKKATGRSSSPKKPSNRG